MLSRSIGRVQGNDFIRHHALRSPVDHLARLLDHFEMNFHHPDDLMLTSAVLLAFFARLRSSEYTSGSIHQHDSEHTLGFHDVHFESNFEFVQVRIAGSKTDRFRVGCKLKVRPIGGRLCPVRALERFVRRHPFKEGTLLLTRTEHP